jgi:hypothetical protein
MVPLLGSLLLLGFSLLRTRLTVGRCYINGRGLVWKRSVVLPKETTVGRAGRSICLHDSTGNLVYQFDRNFNHRNRLETELRALFE